MKNTLKFFRIKDNFALLGKETKLSLSLRICLRKTWKINKPKREKQKQPLENHSANCFERGTLQGYLN